VEKYRLVWQTHSLTRKKLLKPGQKATLYKDSRIITVTDIDNPNYLAWKTHKLVFKETSLGETLKTLEDYYKVEFRVTDSLLLNCRFTGTFDKPSLADVLDVFAFGSDISYRNREISIPCRVQDASKPPSIYPHSYHFSCK
jgi:ferric-dicitrate binding protein FerR (iron transport regulator)